MGCFLSDEKQDKRKYEAITNIIESWYLSFTKSQIIYYLYICFFPLNNNDFAYYQIQIINAFDLSQDKILFDPVIPSVLFEYELGLGQYHL